MLFNAIIITYLNKLTTNFSQSRTKPDYKELDTNDIPLNHLVSNKSLHKTYTLFLSTPVK